jgi:hypothetical protein
MVSKKKPMSTHIDSSSRICSDEQKAGKKVQVYLAACAVCCCHAACDTLPSVNASCHKSSSRWLTTCGYLQPQITMMVTYWPDIYIISKCLPPYSLSWAARAAFETLLKKGVDARGIEVAKRRMRNHEGVGIGCEYLQVFCYLSKGSHGSV